MRPSAELWGMRRRRAVRWSRVLQRTQLRPSGHPARRLVGYLGSHLCAYVIHSELWGVNAVMMQSPGSAGSTELARLVVVDLVPIQPLSPLSCCRLNGVSGAHNDELLDESDTSSRGLFSGRKDLSSDSYDEDGNRKPSNPDLDLTQIPPHKRWSNVPMRYGYRVDNLQDANVFGKLSQDSWSWRTFFSYCGPGFLVAIAYLDPGNLEANLQVRVGSTTLHGPPAHLNSLGRPARTPTTV